MEYFGPKYYNLNGVWDLKPNYLGPWTLRICFGVVRDLTLIPELRV